MSLINDKNPVNQIDIKCLPENGAVVPSYETLGSAGADIRAFLEESVTIKPFERAMIPTGLKFEIPLGYEMQIRPRSGLAAKSGITVLNTPGTIDSDYRGELMVALHNHGNVEQKIEVGERVAQFVITPYLKAIFNEVEELNDNTDRGTNGFGSTGTR